MWKGNDGGSRFVEWDDLWWWCGDEVFVKVWKGGFEFDLCLGGFGIVYFGCECG